MGSYEAVETSTAADTIGPVLLLHDTKAHQAMHQGPSNFLTSCPGQALKEILVPAILVVGI